MSSKSMDVFSLRDTVIDDYKRFATSFTKIHAADIRERVDAIYAESRYWPEPLLQINPRYLRKSRVDKLVADGVLQPECEAIFRTEKRDDGSPNEPLTLYEHQTQAISFASLGHSYVVTTGTGSGKSLCFFIPIVSAIVAEKRRDPTPRTRAIIIYPMNALANSQQEELKKYLGNVEGRTPVTFGRYTGQESDEERQRIAEDPPDILLTNFMMLELLMTRQGELDRSVIGNCEDLRFLVLDELHTYRGRQGADVALLVRRVRERLGDSRLQCIGTSATMASEGTLESKQRVVADVASRLFATAIAPSNVIVETLERGTDATLDAALPKTLGPAIDASVSQALTNEALRKHPLAIWVETTLGISFSETDQRWVRAKPLTVSEAIQKLQEASGRDAAACSNALRDFLLQASLAERERTGNAAASEQSFFAFKLHQFIAGAGHAYATFEPPRTRAITVEGQQFLPGAEAKRLYPIHFCRKCGHEYHPVRYRSHDGVREFVPRDIDDGPLAKPEGEQAPKGDPLDLSEGREVFGFLTLHALDDDFDFRDDVEDYPETWIDHDSKGNARLKANRRASRPRSFLVSPSGVEGSGAKAWFLPGRFVLCLRCRDTNTGSAKDRTRLASLSAEGRSSATTVLVGSTLRWMHGKDSSLPKPVRKLLGFTDNRQDAALQAGHFNDFLFVSLVRAGFLGALEAAGPDGLRSEELGSAQQKALGFDRRDAESRAEWQLDPNLKGVHVQEAERTLRQVLAYRTWFDQRRGWRYTNPNLEQLDLLDVHYEGIEALCTDDAAFAGAPEILVRATPLVRAAVYQALFDHLRQSMAIRSHVLDPLESEQIESRAHNYLRAPWGFGPDEKPRRSRWLIVSALSRKELSLRDEELVVRGGSRSVLGRTLKSSDLWQDSTIRQLRSPDVDRLIECLLRAASTYGLVVEEPTPFGDATGWKLNDICVRFKLGTPMPDSRHPNDNAFFRAFYGNLARTLREPGNPLFGFEAREHTAQVKSDRRELREKRFRWGDKEKQELETSAEARALQEPARFLPVLFCSPTMELGVDISALNVVYMRNVPPTPANYAQRSGRAGRSGQAALVVTYCSSQSPHDQYFFREPRNMVHGEVRAPLIDLANEELVTSHMQAIWLSCTEQPLSGSISDLLDLGDRERPLLPALTEALRAPRVAADATTRIERVLRMLDPELTPEAAPWLIDSAGYPAQIARTAFGAFDAAFSRWRALLDAAEEQRDAARRTMDDYSASAADKRAAKSRHAQAYEQIELLQKGEHGDASDFYTYRYLATEGFLPGYNFPRLPLLAYVPSSQDGRGSRQTFLQRPRFLALAEFGPRNLVYHEGRAFRVVRALFSLGKRENATANTLLPVRTAHICRSCGAGHFEQDASLCHGCGESLGDAEIVREVYRIENVGTHPAERITANDEERQRQGFELQTTFVWATREDVHDVRRGEVIDSDGALLALAYGPGATITRLNKGLRRRADKTRLGYRIDPVFGYFAKNEDEDEAETPDPTAIPRQWIVPSVEDRKNALLVRPAHPKLDLQTLATLQHALLRGIEVLFQLETGELLAEPMPTSDARRGFLLYEATEGGAGVLTRLVTEPDALAKVARQALQIMHFALPEGGRLPASASELRDSPNTQCVAACYRCLLSYYNQPDHEHIDRRNEPARDLLLRIAASQTTLQPSPARASNVVPSEHRVPTAASTAPALERFFALADSRSLPRPDTEPLILDGVSLPLVWRTHYVAMALDELPSAATSALHDRGFDLLTLPATEAAWPAMLDGLARALGRS